ncbi:MAG: hypothetical protein CFH38_00598 [Alphaproteobacteria bacterium MarineAlpha10_Bin1]|nr:MAG: hypothetical protein CFH38_00598 [Alphaproteobacteria bacterium MarineAlpha10_Bin1]
MSSITHDRAVRELVAGRTIFEYADELSVEVPTSCQRNGRCHECVVEIRKGMASLSPPNEAESFLRGDFRLACQAEVISDAEDIEFAALRRRPKILTSSPVTDNQTLDTAVQERGGKVYYEDEEVGSFRGHLFGLAIDLGTTTVAMELIDLQSGQGVRTCSFENPQRFGGSDIMHRISFDGADGSGELQRAVCAAINREILEFCRELQFSRHEIYEITIAANTTMREILFKIDVQTVGQKPYKSLIESEATAGIRSGTALIENARSLGLLANPRARVYGLPLIASHVGGDLAAGLTALDISADGAETIMLVDMGTNTEVFLRHRGRMMVASCPAGPAFEGGLVKYGMPAYDGAIEKISLGADGADVCYETIGEVAPEGLCGSGLIDLLAELRRHDLMTAKGVFTVDKRLFELMLVPNHGITFSKEDASNLGQAKAANYCGQLIVMRTLGVDPGDIDRLYLAGGFAHHVDIASAAEIGLLAPVPEARVVRAGNTSLRGARGILLSRSKRRALEKLVCEIEHIELETSADFFELFVDGCQFKPMPERLN